MPRGGVGVRYSRILALEDIDHFDPDATGREGGGGEAD